MGDIREALLSREVEGALIDSYVAAEYGDEIFQNGIQVKKLLERSFGYGVVLSGPAMYVEKQCRDYIASNLGWIYATIEARTKSLPVTTIFLIFVALNHFRRDDASRFSRPRTWWFVLAWDAGQKTICVFPSDSEQDLHLLASLIDTPTNLTTPCLLNYTY